jgi:SAM-dependent methyltransferase
MSQACICPHCGAEMDPIRTPAESTWGGEIHHICFNDDCTYFVASRDTLEGQGISGIGYRCRMDPRGACGAAPVWSPEALKSLILSDEEVESEDESRSFTAGDFAREDETPDREFYAKPRMVDHLDSTALDTVEQLYGRLIPKGSRILDLMAGPDSHLPESVEPESVTGLGLNQEELDANRALSRRVIHDLNAEPELPFDDNEFDVVLNTVSVDYLTKPVEVFREVSRVLKPCGLFVVVYSNRMFPPKAVRIWKETNELERGELVKKFFALADRFSVDGYFESKGKPRPEDDKYYSLGIPSDPVYALWAHNRP